jgi:tetratricopeptide (TPR) repeat protein/CHAT domain-containing protein
MSKKKEKQIVRLSQQVTRLHRQGKYEEAIGLATQAYDLARRQLKEEHPAFFTSVSNLAALYEAVGDYAQAELLYQRVLDIQRRVLGEQHPDVAVSLNNLAAVYQSMGEYTQAEQLYQRALAIQRLVFGERDLNVATSLSNLTGLYYSMGNYPQSELLCRQALEIRRNLLGEHHPDVATGLSNLAELRRKMGSYTQAEPLYQQALAIQRQSLGEQHPNVAATLNSLAVLYSTTGNSAQAELCYRQALDIQRSVLGEAHPDVATSLNNLAALYREMGRYAQAEPLYQRALAIRRAALGEAHDDVATSLNGLAILYHSMGNYIQAEPLYQRALTIRRAALGEAHDDVATSLNNLASLYESLGDYSRAEQFYRQALEIWRSSLGETHPNVALSLSNLAGLYESLGDYTRAEQFYRQALEIQRAALGETHPDVALSLSNLAGLYESMGDYAQGEQLYRQALEIQQAALGETHPDVALSLNNLAVLYQSKGDHAQAEQLCRQALAIRRTVLGETHPDVATSLNNLAVLCCSIGDYAQAEQLCRQALAIRRTVLGETHPDVATSMSNLTVLYYSMGEYAQAEHFCQRALEVRRAVLGQKHPDIATSLNNLAGLRAATHDTIGALTLINEAATIDDRVVEQVFSIGSERQRMALLSFLQGDIDGLLSLVLQYLLHSREAVQTALDLVLRRKAIGAEVLAAQRDAILGGRYPHLASQLQELTVLRMQIAQRTLAGPDSIDIETHQQLLAKWNAQKERLEADLARQIPEMTLMHQFQTADRRAVASALPTGAALVEFVRFDVFDFQAIPAQGGARWKPAHYVAFVLAADEPEGVRMIDLGEADPIDERIATFIASLAAEANTLRYMKVGRSRSKRGAVASTGRTLRAALFDPLLGALDGRKRLFLAPDGDLTRLPFEVLPIDDEHYVIDDYQISYLSTGRDVLRFGVPSTRQPAPPLVVAHPDFDLSEGGEGAPAPVANPGLRGRRSRDLNPDVLRFEPLPGTRVEGQRIAALLGVQPLLGKMALEATLKKSRSPQILHIATHGFFLPDQQGEGGKQGSGLPTTGEQTMGRFERFFEQQVENPLLRSGLALAGANTWNRGGSLPPEAEDGLLTAEDVSSMDLLGTELVVLSACETGLGKVRVGEGVFGLRRAFVVAGARTLVMSLWKIPDPHTQELMEEFYSHLLEGQSRVDALRATQLTMREKYPQPFYWGAFICQGDPAPLPPYKSGTLP